MKRTAFAVLSISSLIVALGAPLLAQSIRLTANIPFAFIVGTRTMPAGMYYVNTDNPGILALQGPDEHSSVLSLTSRIEVRSSDPAAATRLTFDHLGDSYFLTQVADGYKEVGMKLPVSKLERELSKTASVSDPETVTVLAMR